MPTWNALTGRYEATPEELAAQQQQNQTAEQRAALVRRQQADRAAKEERLRQEALLASTAARQRQQTTADEARRRREALADTARERSDLMYDRAHTEELLGIGRPGSMAALGGVASGGGGGGGGGGVPGGPVASGTPGAVLQTAEIDPAEEAAAKTSAKESAGLRLQSSMKGLEAAMAGRGIRGSGIEASGMADLFAESASDEATAGRERVAANAARTREVGNLNQQAQNQWSLANLQANTNLQMGAADRAAATDNQLRSLLWNYAMRY